MLDEIVEYYSEEDILKADGLDEAIIGIDEKSMRLIYSYNKVIEILKRDMTEEEAIEYYYYNIESAYVGDKTPIWCKDDWVL